MGSVGSLVPAALYRSLNIKIAIKAVTGALEVTVMTFLIIAGSITFSQILAFAGASRGLVELVVAFNLN